VRSKFVLRHSRFAPHCYNQEHSFSADERQRRFDSPMQRATKTVLRVGDWRVDPAAGEITRNGESARIEARTMRLLLCLAEHAGETVSIDGLLNEVWPDVTVTPDSVYQAVASLRRLLGDDPRKPSYIATVPRLGYRMLATVSPWTEGDGASKDPEGELTNASQPAKSGRRRLRSQSLWLWSAGVAIVLVLGALWLQHGGLGGRKQAPPIAAIAPAEKTVAVLPFLDLTEGMKNEEFADGMTEELIDKLSKVPGLRVPSATSSFYFKNKRVALGDIARQLGVVFVLDGSVRKSGARLRVAARLVRADNGFVMWSETYDRPMDDLIMVQDDIAGDVSKALAQSIDGQG
jgi:transcriptional activator of cad operon